MRQINDGVMGIPPQSIPASGAHLSNAVYVTSSTPVPNQVVGDLHQVSQQSGVSFRYLLAQAVTESGGATDAHNRISSATGLFQFTRGTWLQVLKEHGAEHGLSEIASHIQPNGKGGYAIDDPTINKQAMSLRNDPHLSTQMAAHLAKDNKVIIEKSLGRPASDADLYIAHFLGASGAVKLLKANAHNPNQSAAALFPAAARHNHGIFFTEGHKPRSVGAVYNGIVKVIENRAGNYATLVNKGQATGAEASSAVDLSHATVAYTPVSRVPTAVETPEDNLELSTQPSAMSQLGDAVKHTQAYQVASQLVKQFIASP